jgi:hypothetical protein
MIRCRTVWGSAAPKSAQCLRYPNDPFFAPNFFNITVVDIFEVAIGYPNNWRGEGATSLILLGIADNLLHDEQVA